MTEIIWADRDGMFVLADGDWGNPGCECGEHDAAVKIDGEYLCADEAGRRGYYSRGFRLAEAIVAVDGWTDCEEHIPDPTSPTIERFLLVEASNNDDRYWLTMHPTLEAAGHYWATQDGAHYWSIDYVVDLDTGDQYKHNTTHVTFRKADPT